MPSQPPARQNQQFSKSHHRIPPDVSNATVSMEDMACNRGNYPWRIQPMIEIYCSGSTGKRRAATSLSERLRGLIERPARFGSKAMEPKKVHEDEIPIGDLLSRECDDGGTYEVGKMYDIKGQKRSREPRVRCGECGRMYNPDEKAAERSWTVYHAKRQARDGSVPKPSCEEPRS